MIPETQHPDVGAALFEYVHREGGTRTSCGFCIHFGDSPDFRKAIRQLHGAQFVGISYAVFKGDTGSVWPFEQFLALLYAGRSTFKVSIMARDHADFLRRCDEIGGLYTVGQPPNRFANVLRYAWKRRPTIRLRSPIDCFWP